MAASQHPAFQSLLTSAAGTPTLPDWDMAERAITGHRVDAGGTVFLQGVPHPYVYTVHTGLLKLCYLDDGGTEWIKSFAEEGRFFASIAALQPGGRTAFMVTAVEPATLERIDHRVLLALAERHLPWARALYQLTLVFAARKEARERALLTLGAEARYRAFLAEHPGLALRIPQKDLARHLGLTPVGLNRIAVRVRRAGG
ncbi:Crp/Fnr family transcriptional regulator [Acidovorax sp. FJL06]|uniref:Crp/Fnr family transcriptional regulator n=1 Tax=Acidovorax sp. FJL06 TaxID=2153365 RepID=UPI000F583C3B|nr:Crp/Fnr family transcriptional regulator [Acidovorax sp. FJL06]RQO83691.1 Crp/Fnr family transcriptional regulator [Acidovorax sp. FJL06]